MPRDPSGNFTLTALGNPAVTNTPITIAWWNTTSTDFASTFTDSLSRSGLGGMLVPFTLVDGSVTTPAFAFQNESTTGLYRAGAGDVRLSVQGADNFKWTTTTITAYQGFLGPTPNGDGISATASGSADGVFGLGGTGAKSGVAGLAGSASGYGVAGSGASGGLGGYFLSSSAAVDVLRADGYMDLSHATNPATTTGFTNRLTPRNIPKAYGYVTTDGAGAITLQDGFNIASATKSVTDVIITFGTALANNLYAVSVVAGSGSQPIGTFIQTTATGSFHLRFMTFAAPGTPLNPSAVALDIRFTVFGAQ
jgi:hypothetical protein